MKTLHIGTRKSELALWQARWVQQQLHAHFPAMEVELVTIDTKGDKNLSTPLPSVADKGFFTAEIEEALYQGDVDIAVHSLKDLPTELPSNLEVGAFCERADVRDAFLGKGGVSFSDLSPNACVGTSSLRRRAQIERFRPDVKCVDIRGNLNTRWRKLQENDEMDGIILAAAGVSRLGWQERISELFECQTILPAPGQGVIAIENVVSRDDVKEVLQIINHRPSEYAVRAERAFLSALDGGCQTPIGAFARYQNETITLEGAVFSLDGSQAVKVARSGSSPEQVGIEAAQDALAQGASEILSSIRSNKESDR